MVAGERGKDFMMFSLATVLVAYSNNQYRKLDGEVVGHLLSSFHSLFCLRSINME